MNKHTIILRLYWLVRMFVSRRNNDKEVLSPEIIKMAYCSCWPLNWFGYKSVTCTLYYSLEQRTGDVVVFYKGNLPLGFEWTCYRLSSDKAYLIAGDNL